MYTDIHTKNMNIEIVYSILTRNNTNTNTNNNIINNNNNNNSGSPAIFSGFRRSYCHFDAAAGQAPPGIIVPKLDSCYQGLLLIVIVLVIVIATFQDEEATTFHRLDLIRG